MHELIVELDFPIVYTTNFDRNLETAFALHGKEFVKIVNAKDVARAREGVTQIVKLHGDFDDDSSIVIAETDYLDRLSFDSPLDIKFQADALGRTILFVGYSLSDLNIRFLLHRLWKTWAASGYEKDRPAILRLHAASEPDRRGRARAMGAARAERARLQARGGARAVPGEARDGSGREGLSLTRRTKVRDQPTAAASSVLPRCAARAGMRRVKRVSSGLS